MPDFTYKRKTPGAATSPAPTTASSTSPKKESEKSAEAPKAETEGATTPTSSNFVRNGGKYATMVPVSKRAGGEDAEGEGDAERRHSDVDLDAAGEDSGSEMKEQFQEKDVSSDSKDDSRDSTQSAERTSKSDGCNAGDDDGICRPVDKNDVD